MQPNALSLLPPVLAILLAIVTRRVFLSLLVAVATGAVILRWPDPFAAAITLGEDLLWARLVNGDNLRVFAFTMLMGAMIGVMYRTGAMLALVEAITPWARNRRRGQVAGWGLGLFIFFDDYANTLLLGNTLRPVTDKLRLSREKLAYIVDSTAAPVAGLALVSTWVAIEIQFIREGFQSVGLPAGPDVGFAVFLETIPYRFYPIFALVLVGLVAIMGRDFGPMLTAERRAWRSTPKAEGAPANEAEDRISGLGKENESSDEENPALVPRADASRHWLDAVLPILVVVLVVIGLLITTGIKQVQEEAEAAQERLAQPAQGSALDDASQRAAAQEKVEKAATAGPLVYLVSGNSYIALLYAALAGLATSVLVGLARRSATARECRRAAAAGALFVVPALGILWLASSIKAVCDAPSEGGLGTGQFVAKLMGDQVPLFLLPTAVFILASAVSFATGTSWGTMGILMPLVVSVTHQLLSTPDAAAEVHDPLMMATIGSVLAGAIFGDHCSPVSDTTILSSLASNCNHIAHVWTQIPYALLGGAIAILCGTLPAGLGVSGWGCLSLLLLGSLLMAVFLRTFGRRAEE